MINTFQTSHKKPRVPITLSSLDSHTSPAIFAPYWCTNLFSFLYTYMDFRRKKYEATEDSVINLKTILLKQQLKI